MKKKLIPFIFGFLMLVALHPVVHADDDPEQDSGNVQYGTFATVSTTESGSTSIFSTVPECTLTIPRDTTIRKGALSANIGRVTVDGKYFVKPLYVEVSATKLDFAKVYQTGDSDIPQGKQVGDRRVSPKANQDILFDVATTRKPTGMVADDGVSTATGTGHSAADETTFVKNGTITLDETNHDTSSFTETRAARRFWKDETLESGQDANYIAGDISDIKGQENIWLRIDSTQWTGDTSEVNNENSTLLARTKPQGGLYKGSITFTATFKEDYASNMSVWTNIT